MFVAYKKQKLYINLFILKFDVVHYTGWKEWKEVYIISICNLFDIVVTVVPLQDEDTGELIIADDVNILQLQSSIALLLFCFIM